MDVFTSAAELLRHRRPERPVVALRPHAARRAANWFLANFPGRVLYAAKANDTPKIIEALVEAGIRSFDVASLVEIERVAPIRDAELYFMNPVKSRGAIVRAYRGQELRLRQRRGARQDRGRDRRRERPRALPPRRLSQHP
jgi:ornithine decarboxylase